MNKLIGISRILIPSPRSSTAIIRHKTTFAKFQEWYKSIWYPQPKLPPYGHICQLGDPVLRQKAGDVDLAKLKNSQEIKRVLVTMRAVMKHYRSAGISAPQIGIPLRILMIEFPEEMEKRFPEGVYQAREMSPIPFQVFINPRMEVTDFTKLSFPEACESVKGLSAIVPRYRAVTLTGYEFDGEPVTFQATGWAARIVQHEMDHLNGRVYTDIMDTKTLQVDAWYRINARGGDSNLYYKQRNYSN